jgi:hypothetical protein
VKQGSISEVQYFGFWSPLNKNELALTDRASEPTLAVNLGKVEMLCYLLACIDSPGADRGLMVFQRLVSVLPPIHTVWQL